MVYFVSEGFWKNTLEAFNILVKDFNFLTSEEIKDVDFINIFDEKGANADINIPCKFNYFTTRKDLDYNLPIFNIQGITQNLIVLLKNYPENYEKFYILKKQMRKCRILALF